MTSTPSGCGLPDSPALHRELIGGGAWVWPGRKTWTTVPFGRQLLAVACPAEQVFVAERDAGIRRVDDHVADAAVGQQVHGADVVPPTVTDPVCEFQFSGQPMPAVLQPGGQADRALA